MRDRENECIRAGSERTEFSPGTKTFGEFSKEGWV